MSEFDGMQPNGSLSRAMLRVTGFTARVPVDNVPSSERTEVYLGYDNLNLYAVFVCFDTQPAKMRARLPNRDGIFDDDSVTIQLDTFRDQQRAYSFGVNAGGVQGDGVWVEGSGWDLSFDAVYKSDVRRTAQGYIAYLKIPFRSFRFPTSTSQEWGILLNRYIARTTEDTFWPRYTTQIQGRLNQMGTLGGLEKIASGRNLQFIPYFTFQNSKVLDTADPANVLFRSHAADARVGLDSKFVIKDKLVLDVTVNPDFSQVESDDPQVQVNQRFELFFPEKRHFFVENASYFNSPIQLFFTRRIARPDAGIRLTGKSGSNAVGVLVADDRAPGEDIPINDINNGKHAVFEVVRATHDLAPQSFVGIILTHHEFAGRSNTNLGMDFSWKLGHNWRTSFQGIGSETNFGGVRTFGSALYGGAFHDSDHWTQSVEYKEFNPEFQADAGFVPRVDIRNVATNGQYLFRPQKRKVVSWGPSFYSANTWDYSGLSLDQLYGTELDVNLHRNSLVGVFYQGGNVTLRPSDYPTLSKSLSFPTYNMGGGVLSTPSNIISLSLRFRVKKSVNFTPAAGQLPSQVHGLSGDFEISLRPMRGLTIDNTYLYTQFGSDLPSHSVLNDHILRSRWLYQFNPRWSVRLTAEYDALLTNPSLTALSQSKQLNGDALLTYKINYGTALYIGYNHDAQNYDPSALSTGIGQRSNDHLITDGRVFFVKLSYLIRY